LNIKDAAETKSKLFKFTGDDYYIVTTGSLYKAWSFDLSNFSISPHADLSGTLDQDLQYQEVEESDDYQLIFELIFDPDIDIEA
jgi:hypothetical protein